MEELNILKGKINIAIVKNKIMLTLDEIIANRPNATEYIDGMNSSIEDLEFSFHMYDIIHNMYIQSRSRNYDLEKINLELLVENKKLKEKIENLRKFDL